MRRTLRALAVGAAAVALVVGATASPASAKTRTFTDKAGDALPALDITKVKVKNKKHVVVVRLSVPGLQRSKLGFVVIAVRTKTKGRPEYASMKLRFDGTGWTPLSLSGDELDDVRCKGDRMTFGKRSVTVRIPQRCLGGNTRSVKVGAALAARDWLEKGEPEPEPGPDAWGDAYPSITSEKLSPWVRYR
ncbi:hypothetical protein [Mumia sp. Pv 4-285]|uniref:hypothetical protein n=1 Tax=Mumia qirimensis TaxID=3234852 RepID=UPI00351D45FB